VFCAVLAWFRVRFVRFAADGRAATTLAMLAECFEVLGGVPGKVLADRMGCLKGGVVANVVVPTAEYVRFAAHHGFRPDFCEAADPESKGIVENLVGYAKADLMVPQAPFRDLAAANAAARAWCAEVNGVVHGEICAVPAERMLTERELLAPLPSLRASIGRQVTRKVDRLACVRFGSARYSVPVRLIGAEVRVRADDGRLLAIMTPAGEVVAEHMLVAPGEASVRDEHYGGRRPDAPRRAVRPRTAAEKEFCSLRSGCLLEYWPMASPFKASSRSLWVWLAPRAEGERHAVSGAASPGAVLDAVAASPGAFDALAANGWSGMRSPQRRKPAPITAATRAPPHQTASGEVASTSPPMAGPSARPAVAIRPNTEM
jgi:hypothetical protein